MPKRLLYFLEVYAVKTYKCGPATIRVHGEVDKEKLKNAAIQLLKKQYRYKRGTQNVKR